MEQEDVESSSSLFPCSSLIVNFHHIYSLSPASVPLGSRGVSSFQQIPKGVVTSGSGIEDGVPESDQVVLVSSSPSAREKGGEARAASSALPIGCFDPAQAGSYHGNTGQLPVPLLVVWATSWAGKPFIALPVFHSGQIWWVGWHDGWVPQTSTRAHSPCFWTEGKRKELPELLLGGDIHTLPDRSWQGESEPQSPLPPQEPGMTEPEFSPPGPSLLYLAEFSFPDQVLTFVLEI